MARGGKRGHKGGRKQFTNPEELKQQAAKENKKKEWRRQRGLPSESEDDDDEEDAKAEGGAVGGAAAAKKKEESSSSEEESEEESSEDEDRKAKGTEGLIEVSNPNRAVNKTKKVSQLDADDGNRAKPQLSRREREELERQRAKAHYDKLHAAGKTDEARADLARLAIIRKQREEAAKKREDEKKAKEEAAKAKMENQKKALGKK